MNIGEIQREGYIEPLTEPAVVPRPERAPETPDREREPVPA
jgi:hypothetical protein